MSTLTSSTIRRIPAMTLGEVLSGLPGISLRGYGGRQGVQTLSLRGGSSEQTLVLIDGVRANNPQTGVTDLSLMSVAGVERLEVVRGGQSALFGADAVGGVVNIVSAAPQGRFTARVEASAGQSGYRSASVEAGGGNDSLGWYGTYQREFGRGDFPFVFDDGQTRATLRRRGGDFSMITGTLRGVYRIGSGFAGSTALAFSDADRGTPGAVTTAVQTPGARLGDRLIRLHQMAGFSLPGGWDARVSARYSASRETYSDPAVVLTGVPLRSSHDVHVVSLDPVCMLEVSDDLQISGGAEISRASVVSTNLATAVRWQHGLFAALRQSIPLPYPWLSEVLLYPSVRFDNIPGTGRDLSPKIGINIGLLKQPELRVRASAAKSFRAPTFNEQYWQPGGNASLEPERSISYDAGVTGRAELFGGWTADLSAFSIRTRNRITWMPGPDGVWSPGNSGEVHSRGLEANLTWVDPSSTLHITVASTWMEVRKQSEDYPGDPGRGKALPFIPGESVRISGYLDFGPCELTLLHSIASFRYVNEANDRFLPGYSSTDASLVGRVPAAGGRLFLRVAVTNLFDRPFSLLPSYPMPLRQVIFTLGGELL